MTQTTGGQTIKKMQPTAFGRYILLERIASGGMGEVFLAVTTSLWGFEKLFAVKKILPSLSNDPEFLVRFRDEARLVIPMNHPNVVQVYEVGRVGQDYFIAMELVEGHSLGKLLSRYWRQRHTRQLPLTAALYILRELASALDYCHQRTDAAGLKMGVVHRDVSPANVLLSHEGAVKLADFGLALSSLKASHTRPNHVLGHLGYIAPEGLDGRRLDHRADIFSAGVLLFELLTCQRFAPGRDPIVVRRLLETRGQVPPSSIRGDIPTELDEIVRRAVDKDPAARFANARELHDALQRALINIDALYGPAKFKEAVVEPILRPQQSRERLQRMLEQLDLEEVAARQPSIRTVCIGEAIPLRQQRQPLEDDAAVLTLIGEVFEGDTEPMAATLRPQAIVRETRPPTSRPRRSSRRWRVKPVSPRRPPLPCDGWGEGDSSGSYSA
jgi:eukaryotic-like serine/threonine-protein kinase